MFLFNGEEVPIEILENERYKVQNCIGKHAHETVYAAKKLWPFLLWQDEDSSSEASNNKDYSEEEWYYYVVRQKKNDSIMLWDRGILTLTAPNWSK